MARKYVTPGKKTSPGLLKRLGIGILGGMVGGLLTFGGLRQLKKYKILSFPSLIYNKVKATTGTASLVSKADKVKAIAKATTTVL